MFKKIKKVVVFALALTMLMGMSAVAFAAERESEVPELTKVDGMTVAIDEDNDNGISPLWWSGNGPDGFYYWYDCGKITAPGNYTFTTKFRSTNFPYGEKSFSCVFKKS